MPRAINAQGHIVEWDGKQWAEPSAAAAPAPQSFQPGTNAVDASVQDVMSGPPIPGPPSLARRAVGGALTAADYGLKALNVPFIPVDKAWDAATNQMMKVPALGKSQTAPVESFYPEMMVASGKGPSGETLQAPPLAKTIGEVGRWASYGPYTRALGGVVGAARKGLQTPLELMRGTQAYSTPGSRIARRLYGDAEQAVPRAVAEAAAPAGETAALTASPVEQQIAEQKNMLMRELTGGTAEAVPVQQPPALSVVPPQPQAAAPSKTMYAQMQLEEIRKALAGLK